MCTGLRAYIYIYIHIGMLRQLLVGMLVHMFVYVHVYAAVGVYVYSICNDARVSGSNKISALL